MQSTLSQLLLSTLSPNAALIKDSERQIGLMERLPGFSLELLKVIQESDANYRLSGNRQSEALSKSASICFKNFIRRNWSSYNLAQEEAANLVPISPEEREAIKSNVVELMCVSSPGVQRQLSDGVRIVAESDFPDKWPGLLPALVTKMSATTTTSSSSINLASSNMLVGVLSTMNEILKRFRDAPPSDALHTELKYVLDNLQQPLLVSFYAISQTARGFVPGGVEPRVGECFFVLLRGSTRRARSDRLTREYNKRSGRLPRVLETGIADLLLPQLANDPRVLRGSSERLVRRVFEAPYQPSGDQRGIAPQERGCV